MADALDRNDTPWAKLRKAFREQLDAERAVDGLPALTDAQYNARVDELIRGARRTRGQA